MLKVISIVWLLCFEEEDVRENLNFLLVGVINDVVGLC